MTLLKQAIIGIMYLELLVLALFLAACAVGVGLWGHSKFSQRGKL